MSDPLLPVPDAEDRPDAGREQAAEVEDDRDPDVLPDGEAEGEDEPVAEPTPTPFRTPVAGDGVDDDELRGDLHAE